jgi:hypothetical protein
MRKPATDALGFQSRANGIRRRFVLCGMTDKYVVSHVMEKMRFPRLRDKKKGIP